MWALETGPGLQEGRDHGLGRCSLAGAILGAEAPSSWVHFMGHVGQCSCTVPGAHPCRASSLGMVPLRVSSPPNLGCPVGVPGRSPAVYRFTCPHSEHDAPPRAGDAHTCPPDAGRSPDTESGPAQAGRRHRGPRAMPPFFPSCCPERRLSRLGAVSFCLETSTHRRIPMRKKGTG